MGDEMKAMIEQYQGAFAEHGVAPEALFWMRGRQPLRFAALTRHLDASQASVLDFGCGLAHLRAFLIQRDGAAIYTGADVVPEFIQSNRTRLPDARFVLTDGSGADLKQTYDHIVLSGVFNICLGDEAAHWARIKSVMTTLFERCTTSLAVDFMTDAVDFRGDGAWHQNLSELLDFVTTDLSPRFRLDHSYLPFEYSVIIAKDAQRDGSRFVERSA